MRQTLIGAACIALVTAVLVACQSVPINGRFLQELDGNGRVTMQIETATPGSCKVFIDMSDWYVSPSRTRCVANSVALPWSAEIYSPILDFTAIYSGESEEACQRHVKKVMASKSPPELRKACHKV
ncbi:hypothetical protein VVD49_02845 [Uliginosibacterium sp. H3]|uniref:Uncharacterized protein n=1 Tax=Uliginosibacterium silvisoli TaxID=3114758 RepID=A0ABU6JZK2_9RHOO|nr:hypothetical protein [Uliginosibacterium sp. H3]